MVEKHPQLNIQPDHKHRWRINTPEGEFSDGYCKTCGATRTFTNGYYGVGFADAGMENHGPGRGRNGSATLSHYDKMEAKRSTWQ